MGRALETGLEAKGKNATTRAGLPPPEFTDISIYVKVWKFSTGGSGAVQAHAVFPWPCILVAITGILISAVAFQALRKSDEKHFHRELSRRVDANAAQLKSRIEGYQEILFALRNLFLFSDYVSPQEFSAAAKEISDRHSGIQALQWVVRVPGSGRDEFEKDIRSLGFPGMEEFTIGDRTAADEMVPAPARPFYLPVTYTAPLSGNERALGFDLAAGPTIEELNLAKETGEPALTRRVRLVQEESDQAGLVFIMPVYSTDHIPPAGERNASLRGYVQGVFRATDMLNTCFPTGFPEGLNVTIYDSESLDEDDRIFGTSVDVESGQWYTKRELQIFNRAWSLIYTPDGRDGAVLSPIPWFALAGGLAFTALFTAYLGTLLQRTQKVERLVKRRTQQVERMIARLEQEVRERKERETSLRESEGRYRSLFDLSPEGIVIVREGAVVRSNRAWLQLTGQEKSEPGGAIADFVAREDREEFAALLERARAQDATDDFRRMKIVRDGEPVEVEVGAALIVWEGASALQVVVRDCSARIAAEKEQQELQNRFQEAQKLESLGILAGGIAHDFNNLLTGVIGNASLIRMGLSESSPAVEMVDAIETSATRAADLCRQMLAYSGRGKTQIQPVSLTDLVEESTSLLQLSVSKKASLRFDLEPKLPAVMADVTQMRQVVMNLIINASDALEDKPGIISMKTERMVADEKYLQSTVFWENVQPGTFAAIEVTDNGHGMDEDTVGRIFEPFFTTKFTGRGLGLSAVLGIIRSHGGTLKVYSEAGRGSTFRVLMPVCEESPIPLPANAENGSEWKGSGTVLLVDDEPVVRAVSVKMLRSLGFEVVEAGDGMSAVNVFAEFPDKIRLAIVDLTMPRLDGFGTFRELRKIDPDVRVILTSGFNEQEAISQFYGKGLTGFVQKPFRMDGLRAAVRKALDGDE